MPSIFQKLGNSIARRDSRQQREDGWTSALMGFGIQGTDKRLSSHFLPELLDSQTLENLWRSNDIAAKIVEKIPSDALRSGYELGMDDKHLEGKVLKRLKKLGVDQVLNDALNKERAFGGSALFPVLRDDQPALSLPLNEDRITGLSHFQVFEARELIPHTWYNDPIQPKFGEPETYWLFPRTRGGMVSTIGHIVHETRLIIFPGIRVSRDQISVDQWGDSVLQRPHTVIRDWGVAWDAVGAMLTDFTQTTMSIKGLAQIIAQDKDGAFKNRIKAIHMAKSVLNMVLHDSEESVERKQTPVSGLPDLLDKFESRLATAAGMPITVLTGRSSQGMNATGEGDIRLHYDNVAVYQENKVRPPLEQIIKLLSLDKTGPIGQLLDWSLEFLPLWQPSDKEIAETKLLTAQTDKLYFDMGAVSADEIASSRWAGRKYSREMNIDFNDREQLESDLSDDEAKKLIDGTPEPVVRVDSEHGFTASSLFEKFKDSANKMEVVPLRIKIAVAMRPDVNAQLKSRIAEINSSGKTSTEKANLIRRTKHNACCKYFDLINSGAQARIGRGGNQEEVSAARKLVSAVKVKPINGLLPRKHEFAGDKMPLPQSLHAKYGTHVRFTDDAFPDFSKFVKKRIKISITGNHKVDAKEANQKSGFDVTPEGMTWHHYQDGKTMELMPSDLHNSVSHNGIPPTDWEVERRGRDRNDTVGLIRFDSITGKVNRVDVECILTRHDADFNDTLCLWIRVPDDVISELNNKLPLETKIQSPAHVTMLFLGKVDSEEKTITNLQNTLSNTGKMVANVTGMGAFAPKTGESLSPLIGLVNLPGGDKVRSLAQDTLGIIGSDRPLGFIPHITVAMIDSGKVDISLHSMSEFTSKPWTVTEIELVQGDRVLGVIKL